MSVKATLFFGRSFKIIIGKEYNVSVEGTQEEKDTVSSTISSNGVVITQKTGNIINSGSFNLNNIAGRNGRISINGSNISISGNSIYINNGNIVGGTSDKSSTLDITVTVPELVSVEMETNGSYENINLGDVGNLVVSNKSSSDVYFSTANDATIHIQGSGSVIGQNTKNAKFSIQGSGNIKVENVIGITNATVQGSGNIKVKNGCFMSPTINVMGSGDVKLNGKVTGDINANVMGSGDIKVTIVGEHVGNIHKNKMGSGSITIK